MDLQEVALPCSSSELSHGFNEGCTLDIAHCASQFNDTNIGLLLRVVHRNLRNSLDPILNRIRQMGYNLDGLPKIVATTFPLDDVLVDLASCDVVLPREGNVEVSLVITQVEVDFSTIVKDKDLPMP